MHRIGQDRTVFVYRMIATGTIEERIQRLKAEKRALFDRVVGDLADLTDIHSFFRSLSDLVDLQGEVKAAAADAAENNAPAEAAAENGDVRLDLEEPLPFEDPVGDAIAEGAPVVVEPELPPPSVH